jgi:hypothetical protein
LGPPAGRKFANDRGPEEQAIRKTTEFFDRFDPFRTSVNAINGWRAPSMVGLKKLLPKDPEALIRAFLEILDQWLGMPIGAL